MKRPTLILAMLTLTLTGAATQAAPPQKPAFLFGNHIDTHQATVLSNNGGLELRGDFLIIFTGGNDPLSGLPLARHPRGASHDEECGVDPIDCVAGWEMQGVPGAAKFVSHSGVNGNDHPVWLVNREPDELLAGVSAIPQPGYATHFHWITTTSTDPRAGSVQPECDKTNAGQLQTAAPSAVNEVCPGWFLRIRALRNFAFQHGGEVIAVRKGADNRSHINIVTNFEIAPVLPAGSITPTR